MADVDYTGSDVGSCIPYDGIGKFYVLTNRLDFSATNAVASTVVEALDIPAGTHVLNVFVKVITPEGGTSTATVGDDDSAAAWDAATNLNAAAGTITYGVGGTDNYVTYGGKFYSAADTIDLTLSANAVDTAVIDVTALCIKVF